MVPSYMLFTAVVLLVLALIGWGFTLKRSLKQAVLAYQMGLRNGDTSGYARGCLVTLQRVKETGAPKAKKRKKS